MTVTQSCPILCNPMDCLQARIPEWVPFPSPGDLLNPGIEPRSPTLQVDSLPVEPPGKPLQSTIRVKQSLRVRTRSRPSPGGGMFVTPVCVYVCAPACLCVNMCVCICVYVPIYTCVCLDIGKCLCVFICACIFVCVYRYVSM